MSKPKKYDMTKMQDVKRWFREMESYLRVGQEDNRDFVHQGTDKEGRQFAFDAFMQLRYLMKDCEKCHKRYCDPECFNRHPGSMIALGKLLKQVDEQQGVKTNLVKA